ncbi:hypothetical protein SUGI_0717250 [Cryptomeria japonica]|nr:hypothetical protein SUGI_0717250 [Cryptomeria japonica]
MVQENATLTLTSTGELVLEDSDGNLVWSTNTFTQAFLRRVIHESGNLVLYKTSGGIIWQSFDYPTDTILLGQKLKYAANFSSGYCYLDSNIYYMKTNSPVDEFYNSIAYIKVQSKGKHNKYLVVIICASVGGAITLLILLWAWINKSQNGRQQKEKDEDEDEDDHGNWPAGLPLRYTFQELKNEIVSGKRSRELSENDLFSLLQVKAEEGRLLDLVYPGLENEETGIKEEAVKLIKVGMWCVQDNFTRRTGMSIVVKALEEDDDTTFGVVYLIMHNDAIDGGSFEVIISMDLGSAVSLVPDPIEVDHMVGFMATKFIEVVLVVVFPLGFLVF